MSVLGDTWAAGPKKVRKSRSKWFGAVAGFVASASLVAMAAWLVIPSSPGIGYGKGKAPVAGLALVNISIDPSDPVFGDGVGPSESGLIYAKWSNPNNQVVSITQVGAANGSDIVAVNDPTCVAHSPADFTTVPENVPPGTWTVPASNNGERLTSFTLNTTASFPSCLASQEFKINVVAQAVA